MIMSDVGYLGVLRFFNKWSVGEFLYYKEMKSIINLFWNMFMIIE